MTNICWLNRQKVLKRWKRVHRQEIRFLVEHVSSTRALKARLHGYLCGDGSVSFRKERGNGKVHADIRFYPDHVSLIGPFEEALKKVYNKKPTIRKEQRYYRVFLTSKVVVLDLLKQNFFTSGEWTIPWWIQENNTYTREWLRAYFDAEAYVGSGEIRVQTVNEKGARVIQQLLKRWNISCRVYRYTRRQKQWRDNIHIVIGDVGNRRRFLNHIGFNHIEKLKKLRDYLARVA